MKFRKVTYKNKPYIEAYRNNKGVRIIYNPFFKIYQIEKGTYYRSARTLEEAQNIAFTDRHFA